jgi:50S ribosomal protein L16 3-hydroxylase
MLRDWIAPLTLADFRATHFGKGAWAQPGSAHGSLATLDWPALGRVLAVGADTIVCAKGSHLPYPVPRDLDELRAYMRIGVGLAMRFTERADAGLRAVADSFADLPGTPQVQVFATPAGTHGFGWHYDLEDVFIAQTAGVKDYYFRPNTVEADTPFPPKDFSGYHAETSPLMTATLVPGDFLYIPSRWWHMAVCKQDALSISVGLMPPGVAFAPPST